MTISRYGERIHCQNFMNQTAIDVIKRKLNEEKGTKYEIGQNSCQSCGEMKQRYTICFKAQSSATNVKYI